MQNYLSKFAFYYSLFAGLESIDDRLRGVQFTFSVVIFTFYCPIFCSITVNILCNKGLTPSERAPSKILNRLSKTMHSDKRGCKEGGINCQLS